MKSNPEINVQIAEGMGTTKVLAMNRRPEFAPLNDTRVRTAIAYAVFPEEIVEKVLYGTGVVANSPVHPNFPYHIPVFDEIRKFTPEERIAKAKQLLSEAGYPDGFKTDFWTRGGEEREIVTIIQSQLKKIGIDTEIKQIESAVFRDMEIGGKISMWIDGWAPDYADPDTDLYYSMHTSSKTYLAGESGYNSSSADYLLKLGKDLYDPTGDPPERREVYEDLQKIYLEDVVGVVLFFDSDWGAQRSYVKGYQLWNTKAYMRPFWDAYKEIPSDWETKEPPH